MATTYFTGKGYGVSKYTDVTGVPLLSWYDPNTKETITLFDRVAVQVDPTIKQVVQINQLDGGRMDAGTSGALKRAVVSSGVHELDHIISLELGGSNQLANLELDPGLQGTIANPTDTYENQLSAAVQAGAMSLYDAWVAITHAKGKVMAEELQLRYTNNWASAAASVLGGAYAALTNKVRGNFNTNLQALIKQDGDTLAQTPYDLVTRQKVLTEQIDLTAEQLNLSKTDAAAYMKVYTAKYAQYSNNNPTELLAAVTANEQQIMGISHAQPNVLGINIQTLTDVAAYITAGQGVVAIVGIIAFVVALFVAAPEEAGAAAGGGTLGTLLSYIGVNLTAAAIAAGTFGLYEAMGAIASRIPMITKQAMDSGWIVPSLISTSLKDDIASIKAAGGSSSSSSGSSANAFPPGTSGGGGGSGVLVTTVSGGVIGSSAAFVPREVDIIEDQQTLLRAAQNNLSAFLTAMPKSMGYDIKLATRITTASGEIVYGAKNRIVASYTKKGLPHYKTVENHFAILEIYYVPEPGKRQILDKITLGPIDFTNYTPTEQALSQIIAQLQGRFFIGSQGTESSSGSPSTEQPSAATQTQTASGTSSKQEQQPATQQSQGTTKSTACDATDLSEFYQLQNISLPNYATLSALYERYLLGTARTYVGTFEQNTKLLAALKAKLGCSTSNAAPQSNASAGSIAASSSSSATVVNSPTSAQLAARLNPQAFTVKLPIEGQVFRDIGDNTGSYVWKIINGVPVSIGITGLVPNTDLILPDGTIARAGQVYTGAESLRDSKPANANYRGPSWHSINAQQNYDAQNGAGAWKALPAFNLADIQTAMQKNGGKLPNTPTETFNQS